MYNSIQIRWDPSWYMNNGITQVNSPAALSVPASTPESVGVGCGWLAMDVSEFALAGVSTEVPDTDDAAETIISS